MNYAGKFDASLSADGSGLHTDGHAHVETITKHAIHAPADAIIVPDAQLLFNGDFKRSGVDLVLSRADHQLVLHDYFKGEKHAALSSPDGAHLTGDIVDALTGHTQYAQADGSSSAGHAIGHVTKLAGTATVVRNGVSIILNVGDNVEKGDVVQSGSNSTLGVTFIDGTVFGLASNARMVLNEMVYDPNGSNNSSLISLVAGTISFVAGETAKHGDMKVDTPVATMGIRGTAVLCEIDFDVPGQGGTPEAHFQVLVEPDGTTGSYILFDKQTLAPLAIANVAGQQINIGQYGVNITNSPLSPELQKLIGDVFSLRFSDSNPKTFDHFTDSIIPQSLQPIQLANLITATPVVININTGSGSITPDKLTLPGPGLAHIPGPPEANAFGAPIVELAGKTHDAKDFDIAIGVVNFADINAGDAPTVTASFGGYTYKSNSGASLNQKQLDDIKAVGEQVALVVTQDPAHKNVGTATLTYSVPDGAFDFLAAGETLTLTYMADVNNNFALNPEHALVPITITITGTNDVPVITTSAPTISLVAGKTTPGGELASAAPNAGSGTLAFDDVDLTDTHTVSTALTKVQSSGTVPPTTLAAFESALTASISADSTGSGSGTINWKLADLPAIPAGETITLTYTVTLEDHSASDTNPAHFLSATTQTITVIIKSTAEVWIATTESGTHDWNTGTNWETGLAPTASDDAIIITNQLQDFTPLYPVTIDAAAAAKSVTMNDFGSTAPELDNNSSLTIGGGLDLSADAILRNFGTLSVGALAQLLSVDGRAEILNKSVLQNSGTITLYQGGDFQDQSTITNSGTIEVAGGTLNVNGVAVSNTDGEIDATTGIVDLENATINGGTLGGTGVIATAIGNTDSTLNGVTIAAGSMVTAEVGTLDLTGIITNTGGEIDATTGIVDLENATINGGTLGGTGVIATATGNTDSTLNGVTIASGSKVTAAVGTLDLTGIITNTGAEIDASTGIVDLENATINGGTLGGAGVIATASGNTDSTLNGVTVAAGSKVTAAVGTLDLTGIIANTGAEIDASTGIVDLENATINGGTLGGAGKIDVVTASTIAGTALLSAALNTSTVTVDAKLTLDNVTATGTTITDKSSIELDGNVTLIGGATIKGQSSLLTGAIINLGMLEVAGAATLLDDTLTNTGHIVQVDAGQTLNLDNSTITSGTLTILGELDSTGTSFITGATIVNSSHIDVISGTLTIDPAPVTNTGTMLVADGSTLVLNGETITNFVTSTNGTIQVDGHDATHAASFDLEGSTINGGNLIVSGVLDSTGDSFLTGANITYSGTIDVTAGTLIIDATSTLNNTGGKLEADGGNLIVNTAISGNLEIKGTSVLELGSALQDAYKHATVTFDAGSDGTLKLDHAETFDGTVTGLDDNNLDLRDISYGAHTTVSFDSATDILTITNADDPAQVAHIQLTGDYTGVHWELSDDGSVQSGTGLDGTSLREIPGAIAGLDSHGNSIEGAPITASITDGGQTVTSPAIAPEYHWQILVGNQWVDGTGTGVTSATYTPGEGDEGHALRVALSYTDALGNPETSTASAGTVMGTADIPIVSAAASAGSTTENTAKVLSGLSVQPGDGSVNDAADSFTAKVYVEHGALAVIDGTGGDSFLAGSVVLSGDGHDSGHMLTITGTLAAVNAALAHVQYTPTSEFEGTDTIHFTALSTEEASVGGDVSADANAITATITVSPVAEAPVAVADETASVAENGSVAIGVSVGPLAEDSNDSVSAVLAVTHGTLHVGSLLGVTVTGDDSGTLTVSGNAADVNTVLAGLIYTAKDYEGSDTLNVSVTSIDGTNTYPTPATASTAITVNPVAEAPVAVADKTASVAENGSVAIGVSVGPLAEDSDDSVSAVLAVTHGTLHVGSLSGVTVTGDDSGTLTVSGNAADVNTVLAGLTYTAKDYEGSDTLNLSVTSIDGTNTYPTPATASTAITVNPVAEAGTATAPATLSLDENATNVAISGVSVGPLAEDGDDSVSTVLAVTHGTLHVGSLAGVTVANNGTGSVTVSGNAADVNIVLAGLTYTATTEYEGADTLNVTVTSKDGSSTSVTQGHASTAITVNPVAEAGTATAPATLSLNENATNVAISGVSVGPLAEDGDDSVSAVLAVGHGTLHVGSLAGVTVADNGTGSVTVSGSAALVNTVLAGLTYTATAEYEGADALNVTVTSKDGSSTSATQGHASTAITLTPLAPVFTSPASISGTAQEGVTLTAGGTLNESDVTVTYQWQSSSNGGSTWHNITTNGTSQTYTPVEADENHLLRVVETATDNDGGPSATSTSAATAAVAEASLVPTITAGTNTHGTATFNVDFAVAMTGVTSLDFVPFTTNGLTLLDNISVSGSGAHYTVTVTYPTGPGVSETHTSLGLNFVNNFLSRVEEAGDGSAAVSTHITTPQFSSLAPAGLAGYAVNLALTDPAANPGDMITLTIAGAAADWSLNAGTQNSDGSWTVHTNDPGSLMMTPSASFVGAALVHVTETWTNLDGTTGNALVTDNVEAYAPGSPIFALAGDDHLTGAGASDLFVFAQPIGHDVIYNFDVASDKIDLIGFNGVSGFADIQGHIADDANGNAVITIGANETITLNGVHAASVTANDFAFDQTPVTQNAGSMTIGDGAILPLSGIINNTGTIALNSAGSETDLQLIEHGITLQGAGHVVLSDSAENVIGGTSADVTLTNVDNTVSGAGQIGAGQLTLVNEGTIDATGTNSLNIDTGVNTVNNSGTLEATGSGGLVIHSDVVNSGLLWANGGNVTAQGEVSGSGIAKIDGAGVLDFEASSTANVVFGSAAAGTLKLGDSFHFNGTISGFAGSDVIDLANLGSAAASINYSENAAGTGGTLAISNGTQTVELSLLGNYSADNFSIVPDHAKGTLVTYVPHHDLVV